MLGLERDASCVKSRGSAGTCGGICSKVWLPLDGTPSAAAVHTVSHSISTYASLHAIMPGGRPWIGAGINMHKPKDAGCEGSHVNEMERWLLGPAFWSRHHCSPLTRQQGGSMARAYALFALTLTILLSVTHAHDGKPCDKGFVHHGNSTGAEVKIAGLNAYASYPSRTFRRNGRYPAVLLITDIYGYNISNTRLWADNLAKEGFLVVVPDFFKGDPWTEKRDFSTFAAWVAKFPTSQVIEEANAVITEAQQKGVNGYKAGAFGAEGFCWGGKYSDLLATGKKPAVAASIVYHGSRIEPADIQAINAPIYFLQSDPDIDNNFNCSLYQYAVTVLDTKRDYNLDTRLRSYEGMAHGFTIRGDPKNATIQAAAKDAFARGAKFLRRHVKY